MGNRSPRRQFRRSTCRLLSNRHGLACWMETSTRTENWSTWSTLDMRRCSSTCFLCMTRTWRYRALGTLFPSRQFRRSTCMYSKCTHLQRSGSNRRRTTHTWRYCALGKSSRWRQFLRCTCTALWHRRGCSSHCRPPTRTRLSRRPPYMFCRIPSSSIC